MDCLAPDWAITKALNLMEYGGTPLAQVKRDPNENFEVIAFAAYIAAHEPEPVDPLLIEARKLCAQIYPGEADIAPFDTGLRDGVSIMRLSLAALRRGIELAKDTQP